MAARAAACYTRIGATWWRDARCRRRAAAAAPGVVHLHPAATASGGWAATGRPAGSRDARGLHYLRLLLRPPGTDVTALDLSDAVAGHPGVWPSEAGTGEVLDRQALAAYRRRLHEHRRRSSTRPSPGPTTARVGAAAGRAGGAAGPAAPATGLGGRPAPVQLDASERARVAVRKAIATALDRIEAVDPRSARLLRDTVSTGAACRYDPDPARPVTWLLDAPTPTRQPNPGD